MALLILPMLLLQGLNKWNCGLLGEIALMVLNCNKILLFMEFVHSITDLKFLGCYSCLAVDNIFPFFKGHIVYFADCLTNGFVVIGNVIEIVFASFI